MHSSTTKAVGELGPQCDIVKNNPAAGSATRFFAFTAVASLLTTAVLHLALRDSRQVPRSGAEVRFEPAAHDFGEARQASTLKWNLNLVNDSPAPIKVIAIDTSCGCMTTEDISGRLVSAGGRVTIPVTLSMGLGSGEVNRELSIAYRAEQNAASAEPARWISSTLRATIIPDFEVRPSALDFGIVALEGDGAFSKDQRLELLPIAEPVRIVSFRSTHRAITVERGENDYVLCVAVKPEGWLERHLAGYVELRTTSVRRPYVSIPVVAERRSPVSVVPARLIIGATAINETSANLTVRAAWTIKSAMATSRLSGVTIDEISPDKSGTERLFRISCRRNGHERIVGSITVEVVTEGAERQAEDIIRVDVPFVWLEPSTPSTSI